MTSEIICPSCQGSLVGYEYVNDLGEHCIGGHCMTCNRQVNYRMGEVRNGREYAVYVDGTWVSRHDSHRAAMHHAQSLKIQYEDKEIAVGNGLRIIPINSCKGCPRFEVDHCRWGFTIWRTPGTCNWYAEDCTIKD